MHTNKRYSNVHAQIFDAALDFSQEAYASLASFVFTIFFASFSLIAGGISDRYPRNYIAILGCGIWSLATAAESLVTSYAQMVPLRAIVGASQAFYNPAAYTLLADIFPERLIARVNGIFTSGIYIGGGLASLSIILDGHIGWRDTLVVIGGSGLIAILAVLLLVREPRDEVEMWSSGDPEVERLPILNINDRDDIKVNEDVESNNMSKYGVNAIRNIKTVLQSEEARYIFLAATLRYAAGFCIGVWKAPFIFEKFPGSENLFAGTNAVVVSCGGLLSSIIGGYVSDILAKPVPGDEGKGLARSWVPAVGSILAVPAWILFIKAPTPELSILFLFSEYIFAECWFGPTLAALFNAVPNDRRGTAQGIFSVLTAIGNFAPILIGALIGGSLGNFQIGDVLMYVVSGAYLASGLLFCKVALLEDEREGRRRIAT